MNPTLEQLAHYAMQELERGVPESTLRIALLQNGWTMDWVSAAFSAAKQRAMPATNQLTMPAVQPLMSQPAQRPLVSERPVVEELPEPQPEQPPVQPRVVSAPSPIATVQAPAQNFLAEATPNFLAPKPKRPINFKKLLLVAVVFLSLLFVAAGIYRINATIQTASQQRTVRDEERRDDLAVMLSTLSDYYVAHSSYPTRDQMNDAVFLQANSFGANSIKDPKWPADACIKDNKPVFTQIATPSCYAYKATTSSGADCNNGSKPCTRIKLTISLETGNKQYAVTFDKNSQLN